MYNEQIQEEISGKLVKFYLNDNENITYQNLRDGAQIVLRKKLIILNSKLEKKTVLNNWSKFIPSESRKNKLNER